jgi:hypothetical protein
MENIIEAVREAEDDCTADTEYDRTHAWRVEQLERVGLSPVLALTFAGRVDWHDLARLVDRGCPVLTALSIVL